MAQQDVFGNRAALSGALTGAVVGGILGATTGYYSARNAAIGALAGVAVQPPVDKAKLHQFYDALNSGYVPANFWGATGPPVLVEVLLYSTPSGAKLFIAGRPTQRSTVDDLYMLPNDIRAATLEAPGYEPCSLTAAIVPGLQQPDGREALLVRCTMMAQAK